MNYRVVFDRSWYICLAVGTACICGSAAFVALADTSVAVAFTGPSDALALRFGYLGWELAFVYALALDLLRRRRAQLPAALLRHGSLGRWFGAELAVDGLRAIVYICAAVLATTLCAASLAGNIEWQPLALATVVGAGLLQLICYAATMIALLLVWPANSTALIAIAGIAGASTLTPALPFVLPVQAAALGRADGSWPGLLFTALALAGTVATVIIVLHLLHRIRPIDL